MKTLLILLLATVCFFGCTKEEKIKKPNPGKVVSVELVEEK